MKVACIQLRSNSDVADNLVAASGLIRAAAKQGATFIATPENTSLLQKSTKQLFEVIKPQEETEAVGFFSQLAKDLSIHLSIGSMAVRANASKAANRQFLFGPRGELLATYDKINMFDVDINAKETWRESSNYQAGTRLQMPSVGPFKIGMSICYDLRFASLYKAYTSRGANLMLVPAAFTAVTGEAHWETLLRARAIETSSYVMAAAQGGHHENGRDTWGRSMIIDPWGRVIAKLDHDEPGFCVAELSLATIDKVRGQIPAWQQEANFS